MDIKGNDEIKPEISKPRSYNRAKRKNNGDIVKIEDTPRNKPLVLKLRKYGNSDNVRYDFDDSQDEQIETETYNKNVEIKELSSNDNSNNIEEPKITIIPDHEEKSDSNSQIVRISLSKIGDQTELSPTKNKATSDKIKNDLKRPHPELQKSLSKKNKERYLTPEKLSKTETKKGQKERKKQIKRLSFISVDAENTAETLEQTIAYRKACHCFGFSHPFVQQHIEFIKSYFINKQITRDNIRGTYISFLDLKKPYKIIKGFYLMKLGYPFFTKAMSEDKEIDVLDFYDGFVSFRKYASLINPGMMVYFYQTVLYIPAINQMVFAVIPEDQEDLILFHTNPVKLLEFVHNKIKQTNKNIKRFRNFKKQKKEHRFGETYAANLKARILSLLLKEANIDIIFEKLTNMEYSKIKHHETNFLFQPVSELIEKKNFLEVTEELFKKQWKGSRLPIKTNIGEFFFAIKHPKILSLLLILRKNQNLSFSLLPNKVKNHFTFLSSTCQLWDIILTTGNNGETVEYSFEIERQFVDPFEPSQIVWYRCRTNCKICLIEKTEECSYSIISSTGENEINEETPEKCFEKFVGEFKKGGGSRRIMLEWLESQLASELKEYSRKDKVLELFKIMYEEKNTEKSQDDIQKFEDLIQKSTEDEKKIEKFGIEKLSSLKEQAKIFFKNDKNVELIDGAIFISIEK